MVANTAAATMSAFRMLDPEVPLAMNGYRMVNAISVSHTAKRGLLTSFEPDRLMPYQMSAASRMK